MLLFEALSNFSPSEGITASRGKPRVDASLTGVNRLLHPNRKLSTADVDVMIELYMNGGSVAGLARQFGIHEQTCRAHLKRAGVALRPKQALAPEQINELCHRYVVGGTSLRDLARELDCGQDTIRRALLKHGVVMRRQGRPAPIE